MNDFPVKACFLHKRIALSRCSVFTRLALATAIGFSLLHSDAATYSTPRPLAIGDVYELRRDGWSDPPGGQTYIGDVIPKTDANDGLNGDNPYYRRHNVARAWSTDVGYWFTTSEQYEGEPDPAGEQWVDYAPTFEVLGPGRYAIYGSYRWGSARASYPAVYRVYHALGTSEVLRDQRIGSPSASIVYFLLGEFEMRPGSFVRVEDTGTESITFAHMRFRLLAPVPRLDLVISNQTAQLSWPTNNPAYHLESAAELSSTNWVSVAEPVQTNDAVYTVSLPLSGSFRFFRLAEP